MLCPGPFARRNLAGVPSTGQLIYASHTGKETQTYMTASPGDQSAEYQNYSPYQPPGGSPSYPPAPGYWQQPGYPVVQQRTTDGLAIASMVLGIVWVWWIGSILAVIFGHIALRRIAREGKAGRGMAIAGLVLGYIGVGILALIIIVGAIEAATSHNS